MQLTLDAVMWKDLVAKLCSVLRDDKTPDGFSFHLLNVFGDELGNLLTNDDVSITKGIVLKLLLEYFSLCLFYPMTELLLFWIEFRGNLNKNLDVGKFISVSMHTHETCQPGLEISVIMNECIGSMIHTYTILLYHVVNLF